MHTNKEKKIFSHLPVEDRTVWGAMAGALLGVLCGVLDGNMFWAVMACAAVGATLGASDLFSNTPSAQETSKKSDKKTGLNEPPAQIEPALILDKEQAAQFIIKREKETAHLREGKGKKLSA